MPDQPSRMYATPAQIDAFLRQHFCEDTLLHFYRAVGDEVLDEAITHGKEHRAVMESRNCKHVYLAGMADVMDEMWGYRYYPATLPKMDHHDRPHMRPPALHPDDSTYHPSHTRLPSPKIPAEPKCLCGCPESDHQGDEGLGGAQCRRCPGDSERSWRHPYTPEETP